MPHEYLSGPYRTSDSSDDEVIRDEDVVECMDHDKQNTCQTHKLTVWIVLKLSHSGVC
ncbi:hypothetical protein DPMN_071643 [Dreissena polymorpha]|uniref:Uncharacterized protein n=1 Tax=Dreissena polymorpha TaxID=45954 RepID=A0A9D3Z515_DREPO|nr:hypothetical protein DPMN_071643 [Dreissena polymorpha]